MNKKTKITIVGTGAFGTAVADAIVPNKNIEVILFGIDKDEVNDINKNHKNSKYFHVVLSEKLKATTNAQKAFDNVDIIMLALPSKFIGDSLKKTIIPNLKKPSYFINLSKGFDFESKDIIFNVMKKIIPKKFNNGILKLSGASFAAELISKQPTNLVLASDDIKISNSIYKFLTNDIIIIEPSDNIIAIEWISIIKNSLAILLGIIEGLDFGINTKSIFFTLALKDIFGLLEQLNLDNKIVMTSAGIGDLFLTGSSNYSRNFSTGMAIGKKNSVSKDLLKIFATVEGIRSIKILKKSKIELMSIELLYSIIYNDVKPSEAISNYLGKII